VRTPWTLVACGCGTANYWAVGDLARRGPSSAPVRAAFCDRAEIREHNAVTCPLYTKPGRRKCERLAELAGRWSRGKWAVEAIHGSVERLPWDDILSPPDAAPGHRTIVLVGLDRWPSRLAVAEGLRCASARTGAEAAMVQIGLDRGQAAVGVFGCRLSDPCPACGLATLPEPEPCVVLAAGGKLLRGNLHSEARAAGRLTRRIVCGLLGRSRALSWINTKSHLIAARPGGRRYRRLTRPCRAMAGCMGPHAPAATIRWDDVLEPLTAGCTA